MMPTGTAATTVAAMPVGRHRRRRKPATIRRSGRADISQTNTPSTTYQATATGAVSQLAANSAGGMAFATAVSQDSGAHANAPERPPASSKPVPQRR